MQPVGPRRRPARGPWIVSMPGHHRAPVPGPGWAWASKPVEDEADLTVGVRNIPGSTHVTPLHPRGDTVARTLRSSGSERPDAATDSERRAGRGPLPEDGRGGTRACENDIGCCLTILGHRVWDTMFRPGRRAHRRRKHVFPPARESLLCRRPRLPRGEVRTGTMQDPGAGTRRTPLGATVGSGRFGRTAQEGKPESPRP